MPGAANHIANISNLANCPERLTKKINVMEGLELHEGLLTKDEELVLVKDIEALLAAGERRLLPGETFMKPQKNKDGNGRRTMQFGCAYEYRDGVNGFTHGIKPERTVCGLPPCMKAIINRLVVTGVVTKAMAPDSVIVNSYQTGDCIPPHVDHHDFERPFCTLSLLSEQSILFGQTILAPEPGVFEADVELSLPRRSVLVLAGNGADVAKHCIPCVDEPRISITLRKMRPQFAQDCASHLTVVPLPTGVLATLGAQTDAVADLFLPPTKPSGGDLAAPRPHFSWASASTTTGAVAAAAAAAAAVAASSDTAPPSSTSDAPSQSELTTPSPTSSVSGSSLGELPETPTAEEEGEETSKTDDGGGGVVTGRRSPTLSPNAPPFAVSEQAHGARSKPAAFASSEILTTTGGERNVANHKVSPTTPLVVDHPVGFYNTEDDTADGLVQAFLSAAGHASRAKALQDKNSRGGGPDAASTAATDDAAAAPPPSMTSFPGEAWLRSPRRATSAGKRFDSLLSCCLMHDDHPLMPINKLVSLLVRSDLAAAAAVGASASIPHGVSFGEFLSSWPISKCLQVLCNVRRAPVAVWPIDCRSNRDMGDSTGLRSAVALAAGSVGGSSSIDDRLSETPRFNFNAPTVLWPAAQIVGGGDSAAAYPPAPTGSMLCLLHEVRTQRLSHFRLLVHLNPLLVVPSAAAPPLPPPPLPPPPAPPALPQKPDVTSTEEGVILARQLSVPAPAVQATQGQQADANDEQGHLPPPKKAQQRGRQHPFNWADEPSSADGSNAGVGSEVASSKSITAAAAAADGTPPPGSLRRGFTGDAPAAAAEGGGGSAAAVLQPKVRKGEVRKPGPRLRGESKVRTLPCKYFPSGSCSYGDRCSFIHTLALDNQSPQSNKANTSESTRQRQLKAALSSPPSPPHMPARVASFFAESPLREGGGSNNIEDDSVKEDGGGFGGGDGGSAEISTEKAELVALSMAAVSTLETTTTVGKADSGDTDTMVSPRNNSTGVCAGEEKEPAVATRPAMGPGERIHSPISLPFPPLTASSRGGGSAPPPPPPPRAPRFVLQSGGVLAMPRATTATKAQATSPFLPPLKMFSMAQPFAALVLNGVKTIETRGLDDFAALASPGEVLLLHVGFKDWPSNKEQPKDALCGGGSNFYSPSDDPAKLVGQPPFLTSEEYGEACSLTAARHGFTEDEARGKIVGLVKVGRSWPNPFIKGREGEAAAATVDSVPELSLAELQRGSGLLRPPLWLTEILGVVRFKQPLAMTKSVMSLPTCPERVSGGAVESQPSVVLPEALSSPSPRSERRFLKLFDQLPRKVLNELKGANPGPGSGEVVDDMLRRLREYEQRHAQHTREQASRQQRQLAQQRVEEQTERQLAQKRVEQQLQQQQQPPQQQQKHKQQEQQHLEQQHQEQQQRQQQRQQQEQRHLGQQHQGQQQQRPPHQRAAAEAEPTDNAAQASREVAGTTDVDAEDAKALAEAIAASEQQADWEMQRVLAAQQQQQQQQQAEEE